MNFDFPSAERTGRSEVGKTYGFRCGSCQEYNMFRLNTNEEGKVCIMKDPDAPADRMAQVVIPDVIHLENLFIVAGGVKYKLVRVDEIPVHLGQVPEKKRETVPTPEYIDAYAFKLDAIQQEQVHQIVREELARLARQPTC